MMSGRPSRPLKWNPPVAAAAAAAAAAALVAGLVAAPRPAAAGNEAAGLICQGVEPGVIDIDAALDDWRGFAALGRGERSADASFDVRCAFDQDDLFIAVRVRDERLIRSARGGPDARGEDALHISLRAQAAGAWTMLFAPGTRGFPSRRAGGEGARADDSLLDDGWQLELAVPLRRIPGWGPSTPLVLADLWYADVDRAGGAVEGQPRLRGALEFSTHLPALRGFLSAAGLRARDLRLDQLADVDGMPGTERVVAGGRYLGVLSDSFAFIQLPLASPGDLLRVELVDFDGDGRSSVLAHYRQLGGGGSREVVTVWRVTPGGQLERALAVDVALELGGRRLTNRWSLVPAETRRAGGKRARPARRERRERRGGPPGAARGLDILVEVAPEDSVGWDAASFARVTPSPDARPILTPWSGRSAVVYYFDGEEPLEAPARPAPARPHAARPAR